MVRYLDKPQYALFAIANSMLTNCTVMADLGIGIGVRSIGGRVWGDPYRFGQLLNTAIGLRKLFASISFSIWLPIAAWMLWHNGASPGQTIFLCLAIATGGFLILGSSVWAISPLLHGEYRRNQKLDLGTALLRLGLVAILAVTWINAVLAVFVGVVGNFLQNVVYRRWAREKADDTAPPNYNDRSELLRLSVKSLPNTLFYCMQGQLTLFILAVLGSPTGIADVTAPGRLATLFGIFSIMFLNVIGPRFARCQDPRRLSRLYVILMVCTSLALTPLLLVAWIYPEPLLWLLGGKYQGLREECTWVVAGGCVAQVGVSMQHLNLTRAWIRVQSFGVIPAILGLQVVAALYLDLRRFHDILVFGLVTAAAPLPIYILDAWLGLRVARQTQVLDPPPSTASIHIEK